MKRLFACLAVFLALFALPTLPVAAQDAEAQELPPEVAQMLEGLTPRTGKISIPEAKASLDLGEDYIFYNAEDAQNILILWGNPPDSVTYALGLVMPAGSTPLSDTWGAVVSFDETGYVSDEDAAQTDYDELMETMQEGTQASNDARVEAGYPAITLVGWAERPKYDASNHSVVWAQDLAFTDQEVNTLNYDVRTLGRYGVLSLNLVSSMPELDQIRVAARDFAGHASFDQGARYQDYNPATDAAAEYGIAGLIAAGAGAAAAKKAGIFAIILKFIKPILIGLGLLVAALWSRIAGLFGGGRTEEEYDQEWEEYAEEQSDDLPEADALDTSAADEREQ